MLEDLFLSCTFYVYDPLVPGCW